MKKLLLLIFLIPYFGIAQDSTSFSTQEVKEFVPLNIMDEYEKAYGREQKISFKGGLVSTPFQEMLWKPFIEFGVKLNRLNALAVGLTIYENSYRQNLRLYSKIQPYFEAKHYFKSLNGANNFNGKYLSVYTKLFPIINLNKEITFPYSNFERIQRNTFELRYGYQFGSAIDFSLAAGLASSYLAERQEDGKLNYYQNPNLTPFITSNFRFGFEFFNKKRQVKNCEFLDCNKEVNKALKLNLMDLFYVDKYFQSFKLSPEYEQRIGKSAFTFTINPKVGYYNRSYYPFSNRYDYFFGGDLNNTVEKEKISTSTFIVELNTNVRWYFLQNRNIRKGVQNRNLDGIYMLAGIRNVYANNLNILNVRVADRLFDIKNVYKLGVINLGWGLQSTIKEKYFFDYFLTFGVNSLSSKKNPVNAFTSLNAGLRLGILK